MSRLQPGFAGMDPPDRWPPTRGRFRPERLEAPLDALPGVGPTLDEAPREARARARRRPARSPPAPLRAPGPAAEDLRALRRGGGADRGPGRERLRRAAAGAAADPDRADHRRHGTRSRRPGSTSRGCATSSRRAPRCGCAGSQNRYGFAVRSYDLDGGSATADFAPVYPASEEISAAKLRELVEAALPLATDRPDPLPAALKAAEGLPLRGDALVALHRPRSLDEAEQGRRRLAFDELLVLQLALARRAAEREATVAAALPRAGRARRPLPGRAALRADAAPGAGDRRDRRRPRTHDADVSGCSRATSAPGRRWSRSTRCCARSRRAGRAR